MLVSSTPARLRFAPSWVTAVIVALVLALGLVAVPGAAQATEPVGATDGITVTSRGDTVLAGGTGRVTVTGRNGDGADLYNATAVVVLPVGVTYVPGSATPGGANGIGDPVIRTWVPDPEDPDAENPYTAQVLVWENVADLPLGASTEVAFAIEADDDRYPVGSTFQVGSGIYANSNERVVPTVDVPESGAPVVTDATEGGSVDADVTVIALSVSKSERANAEAEVYRGPANPATFRVTVRTAPMAGSDGVIVEDFVPATFTVLGCDDAAYTCEIVEIDGDVFTKLTWELGDLDGGRTIDLDYDAYVGLREVTLPDAEEAGAPTRPTAGGYSVTNTVDATGTYTGGVVSGASTEITTSAQTTVTVLDVGIVKSVAPGDFAAGSTKKYSFTVRTSEYVDASGITVVDTIPDGMCPVIPADIEVTGDAWPEECADAEAGTGAVSGEGAMESVDFDAATGTFTVGFSIADRDEDEDATVDYEVYMRDFYQDGSRTSVGDTFTNSVHLEGTVDPVGDNDVDTGSAPGENGSSATIGTSGVTLTKTVWANPDREAIAGVAGTGTTCDATDYTKPTGADVPALQLGDLVCFRIDATFPDGVATRDVYITDFLPMGAAMVAWSARTGDGWTTVEGLGSDPETTTRWRLGEQIGSTHYVAPGDAFQIHVLARVDSVPAVQPRVTGNLAKMRYTSGAGTIMALRDDVDLQLSPAPPLSLDKKVDGADSASPVREGEDLVFTIDVSHDGTAGDLNDYPLDEIEVWDVLPAGFDCDDIRTADPAIAAADCAARADGRIVVTWVLDLSDAPLRGGEETRISYTLRVPSPLSISSAHTNTAAVTRFTAVSTNGLDPEEGGATFFPANPVDAYPGETKNAAQASDSTTITLPGADVDKAVVTTSVTETNNSERGEATIGETVTWSYSATVPARTSIFNGLLDEQPPASARWAAVGVPTLTTTASGIVSAAGCTRDATEFRLCADPGSGFGDLLFPTTWTNDTDDAVTFTVTLTMRVTDVAGNGHGDEFVNTAVLSSTPTTATTGALERARDAAEVTVVVPAPALQKQTSLSATSGFASTVTASGGQTVYFRLSASTPAGTPPLHDATVVDCVPAGLVLAALPSSITGPVAGTGANGCATGTQRLTWTLPSALLPDAPQSITYEAAVPDEAVSGRTYANTARLSGSTLAGTVAGERTVTSAPQTATVTVQRPTVTKTANRLSPNNVYVAGETVTWTVTATIPAHTTFHDAAITDTLPAIFQSQASSVTPTCSSPDGLCASAQTLTASAGTIGLSLGTIEAATAPRQVSMTFSVTVPTVPPTSTFDNNVTYTNSGVLRWNYAPGTPPQNAASSFDDQSASPNSSIVLRRPSVSIAKTVALGSGAYGETTSAAQGDTLTFRVIATANSSGTTNRIAYNVVVEDTVPAGIVVDTATISDGGVYTAATRKIRWTIPVLQTGTAGSKTFTYRAALAPAAQLTGDTLTNRAGATQWDTLATGGRTITSTSTDPASVTPAFPRINTAKTQITPNPVYIGDEVTFTVTLSNAGGATATSMDAVDVLPNGWTYVAGSTVIDSASAADPGVSGQTLTWADLSSRTPGQQHTITYRAVAGSSVAVGSATSHTNTARAADVTDATGGTSYSGGTYIGTTGEATALIHQADLQITKAAGTFTAGGSGTFTLTVRNNGADAAVGVSVTDTLTLPEGVTFTSATGTGWTCTTPNGAGVLTCTRADAADTLAAGASWPAITVTVAIAADVVTGTTVPNTATVAARTEDRTPGNNTSTATGSVVTSADLRVVKTLTAPSSGAVVAGRSIEWSVTLTNLGPSVSRGTAGDPIVLTDTLPAGVSGVTLTGTVPTGCAIASGVLTCSIARDFAVGESITVRFAGTVDSSVAAGDDVIVNTARVTPVTPDPVAANNTSTVRTDVAVEEDLTIVKEVIDPAPPAAVVPGEQVSYRIEVGNRGPSDARGVSVLDTLPEWTTFDEITAGGSSWTASVSGRTVRFALTGALAAGEDAPALEYTVTLSPAFTGASADLLNTASVSSTWQADQATDTAQPGPAQPSADLSLTKAVRPSSGDAGDPVRAGETAIYTFTTANRGPSDAGAVTLTDTLPAGLSFVTPLPAGCTADGQDLECVKAAGLDAGETPWLVSVTVRVAASFQGSVLTNAATVSSTTPDPVPGDNVDEVDLPVIQRAHLTVDKRAGDDEIRAGEDVEWTITVGNDGPSDARGVTLADVLDPRLILVGVDAASPVVCNDAASLSCTIGTIPAGGEVVVTVTTTVRSSVPDGATIPNEATATSTTFDASTGEPSTATDDAEINVVAVSELTIVKTTTTPTADAGGNAVFRLAVGNSGPSDAAASVVVTDTLPDGLTFVSASTLGGPALWSCAADEQDVVCELQDAAGDALTLPAGADAPVLQLVAAIDPSLEAGDVVNGATVTSPSEPTPPTDTATVEVETFADLGITKTADGAPTAGEEYSWTIEVTNHGPSDSVATADDPIVVVDALPAGVSFVSAEGTGADCAGTRGDVVCEISETLAPGDTVSITLTVAVAEDVSGTLSNTAVVTPGFTSEPASPTWPNQATHVTPAVVEEADLAIEKVVVTGDDDIVAGQPIRWQLTVTNLGPSDSDADADDPIVVTDTLPVGVTADGITPPSDDWSCEIADDGTSISCTLASDLATADPQVFTVDATVGPDVQGDIVNTAVVAPGLTPQPSGTGANDEDTATSTVAESADLRLLKDVRTAITAGATGTYAIQVFNDGPSTARGITVTDTLPDVLTFARVVTAAGETSPWSCAADADDPTLVTCEYDGTIAPGPDPVELVLEVSAGAGLTGDVTNRATVTSTTPDPDEDNNSDSVIGVLVTTADLTLAKSHDADARAVAGEEFTWTLTVGNDGPSDSVASADEPIVVIDSLPAGVSLVADGSDAACAPSDADAQRVVCEITSTIAAGDEVEIDLRVALAEDLDGEVTNTAVVVPGATADEDPGNNGAEDTVTITEVADLTIAKEVVTAADEIVAGGRIEWTLAVVNEGPSNSDADADHPITVVDTLPAGVSFVSAEGSSWECLPGDAATDGRESVVCERIEDLAVGAAPVITVTGLIAADVQGTVRNVAVVTPGLTPNDGGEPNGDDAESSVNELTDLALGKAVSETITAGGSGAYTLTVTNLGPSAARGITVVDTLPSGLSFAGVTGDGWTCEVADGDVVCAYDGILAPAATASFVLEVDAAQDLQGDIVNTAVVATTTPESELGNNTGTATGTIAEVADLSIVKTATGAARIGEESAYELSVSNAGPSRAVGVRIEDAVPSGLEIVEVAGDGWTCAVDGTDNRVACLRESLASGATAPVVTLRVRVLADAYPEVSNTATVTATTPEDPATTADNTSTATVSVPPLSDLVITKTLLDELVTGSSARYEITVVNEGPTEDPGPITVTDELPQGLFARGWTVDGADGTCETATSVFTCTIERLGAGQAVTLILTVDVASTAVGELVNTATVSSDADTAGSTDAAAGDVTVVELPASGGVLAPYLPVGIALILLGAAAVWWARRQRVTAG